MTTTSAQRSADVQDSASSASAPSRAAVRTGRILSGIALAFLIFDASLKLSLTEAATQSTVELGYPASSVLTIGIIELACLIVALVPRTAVLGAVLWTGYLGGAVATHLRVGNPLFSHILFPTYIAALLWGGLWLRDLRVRALLARH